MSVRPLIGLVALALAGACNKPPAAAASQTPGAAATTSATPSPASAPAGQPAPAPAPGAAGAAPATPGPPTPEAPKPVPAVLPQVLARINGQPIGRAEFEAELKKAETNAGRAVPTEQRDSVYRQLLDRIILFRLLASEAKVRGITVTPAELAERLAEVKKDFPSEAEFQKKLAERKTTMQQVEDELRRDILHAKTIEAEVAPRATVTQQDLDAYYKQFPDQFKEPETVRASHILFSIPDGSAADVKAKTRAEADGVLKRAKGGEDFAGLAKQYSKDPGSAAVGGDLNYFDRAKMVPQFSTAAFALKTGEISGLVETPFGLHIIKLTDRRPGRDIPLAEVTPQLTGFLKDRRQKELMQQYLISLKTKYRVEVLL